eukprot:m.73761 g.73761  ORF g.73761 m.73761 type:complete len:262 (-) comp7740_c0_seq2:143-928(-)
MHVSGNWFFKMDVAGRACLDWQKGRCGYGSECKFAHDAASHAAGAVDSYWDKRRQQRERVAETTRDSVWAPSPERSRLSDNEDRAACRRSESPSSSSSSSRSSSSDRRRRRRKKHRRERRKRSRRSRSRDRSPAPSRAARDPDTRGPEARAAGPDAPAVGPQPAPESATATDQPAPRVPRRGEYGMPADVITSLESEGFVMSGSRSRRSEPAPVRKDTRNMSAKERQAVADEQLAERARREQKLIADLRDFVSERRARQGD